MKQAHNFTGHHHLTGHRSTCGRRFRQGISLFEVVLALAIFVGALAAISQILRAGSRAAIRAQLQSHAALLGERQMNEILSGVTPLETVSQAAFPGLTGWSWSLNVTGTDIPGLLRLELTVEHSSQNPDALARCVFTRLMRDPQIYVDAAEAEAAAAAEAASASE